MKRKHKESLTAIKHFCFSTFFKLLMLILFSFPLLFPNISHAQNNLDKVTLQLKWFHQFQFAGYYAALEKGFYKDEGLEVTILERDLKSNPIDQVLTGNADFGVSNSETLLHYLRGKNIVLLASIYQHSPLVFISKTSPLLHDVRDLIGKKVLMSSASQDIELKSMLQKTGVSLDRISQIDRFAKPEDYFDPNIDVIAAYITNQPYYLKKENIPYSVIYPSTYGVDFYGDTLFTSRNQIRNHPERVRKFLRASLKGWKYALEHPNELIEIIIDKFGSLKDREHLKYEADRIEKLILPQLVRIGHTNPDRWEKIRENFKQQGLTKGDRKLDAFFYDPSEGSLVIEKETAILATTLFFTVLIILLFTLFITNRLKQEVATRKQYEEKLLKSEKYYRSLFENTGTATVILGHDFLIKRCNENFTRLCGLSADQVENKKKWTYFVAPEELKRMAGYSTSRQLKNHSTPKSYDFKFRRADGEIRNVHVNVEVIDETTDRIASLIDMTEKVKTQELLVQTEKMISVGGLAAGMAHEINNPLAGILQGAQNILRRVSPNIPTNVEIANSKGCSCTQIYEYLEERGIIRILEGIQSSGERAANIVKNMLNFTRRNDVGKTSCNFNELFDDIINIISCDYDLRKKYDFKHTKIVKEYQEEIGLISCLRIEIEQVLLNLIKNAAYAMYEISAVRTPTLTLRTRMDDKYIIAEVEDNGPGISAEIKRRIFEPFFTTKSPGLGTGLGLSVSYLIITQNHNGILDVESEIGKGTKFTIKIPKI